MKVYLLTEQDFERLLANIDRDPEHGATGGSSASMGEHDRRIYHEAYRFFNYQVRTWISSVSKSEK